MIIPLYVDDEDNAFVEWINSAAKGLKLNRSAFIRMVLCQYRDGVKSEVRVQKIIENKAVNSFRGFLSGL
jgi:hypothetical protein